MNEPQSIFIIDDSKGQIAKEAVSKIKEELEKQGNLVVVLSDATIIKNTIQTEPQLSAEMEERFIDWFNQDRCGMWIERYSNSDMDEIQSHIKHFLATALEEQRKSILREVEELVRKKVLPAPKYSDYEANALHTRFTAIINQLKEEGK